MPRLRMGVLAVGLVGGLTAAACTPQVSESTVSTVRAAPPATVDADTATSTDPDTSRDELPLPNTSGICADREAPFSAEGVLPAASTEEASTDATTLATLDWDSSEACDRLEFTFVTAEGAPAVTPPLVVGTFLRDAGVLRIDFDEAIDTTAWSRRTIESEMVTEAFVVRRLEGHLSVDLHLATPAFARIAAVSSPAALLVDLVPGGVDYPAPPVVVDDTVIVRPTGGSARYPVTVEGYRRTEEGVSNGTLAGGGGTEARSASAVPDDDVAWRGFVMVFPNGPTGTVVFTLEGSDGTGAQTTFTVE